MNRLVAIGFLLSSLIFSTFLFAQQPEDAQTPPATQPGDVDVVAQIQQLKADVDRLNQEVNLLKTEIKRLQNPSPQASIPQASIPQASSTPASTAPSLRTPPPRVAKAAPASSNSASPSPTAATALSSADETVPVTTLLFRDGRRVETRNYAIVGESIWIYTEDATKKYRLSDLDVDGTKKINADHGVVFQLPPAS